MQQFEEVFGSENVQHLHAATLAWAPATTFACAAPSDHAASIGQIEILVLCTPASMRGRARTRRRLLREGAWARPWRRPAAAARTDGAAAARELPQRLRRCRREGAAEDAATAAWPAHGRERLPARRRPAQLPLERGLVGVVGVAAEDAAAATAEARPPPQGPTERQCQMPRRRVRHRRWRNP